MQRTILIVDDIGTNREILKKILGTEYHILEAVNGAEALAVLQRFYKTLSAVLLDLVMPVMNGFELLERMRADDSLSRIPVIITTGKTEEESEVRALELGANDYITKPYNSTIIRQRIRNTINLRETAATVNALQRDKLTGLYNREVFFEKSEEIIALHEDGYFTMSSLDIDNFKVINDQYGTQKGDAVLKHVAGCLDRWATLYGGMCSRLMADNFAVLLPTELLDSGTIAACHKEMCRPACIDASINIRIGRCTVTDRSLSASAVYDRATMAENSIKGRYDAYIAQYDESMRDQLLQEQKIVDEMRDALANGEFEVWFQPQINHASGALVGAEALVRWRHPQRGLISPGVFIPVFERNGFIYEMDKFVWERTCVCLRKWLDEGRKPLPVSANISRYDLFRTDIIEVIGALTEQYQIPTQLLRFEVTESAFAESTDRVIDVVERLRAGGFMVEIDDFGSGYSSLNTLKDVPADILKLDMRFLENGRNSARGGNILESIVRMAKWLGMPVIAEGVETREQADYLKSIGCYYIQGYLYARPMTAGEYEAFTKGFSKESEMLRLETVENMDNNAFWDPASMETLIFNSYVGAACIFEYHNGRTELLRINENYARELGFNASTAGEAHKLALDAYMDAENERILQDNILYAIETGAEASCEIRLDGLNAKHAQIYIRTIVRVIARTGKRYLLYGTILNMTALRESERKERAAYEQMAAQQRELLDNLPCGAAYYRLNGESLSVEYLNRRYQQLVGRTVDNPAQADALGAVHPDDRAAVEREIRTAIAEERDITCTIRLRYGYGMNEYRLFHVYGRIIHGADGGRAIYATFSPIPGGEASIKELLPLVLSAITDDSTDLSFAKDQDFRYICCSRTFAQMAGKRSESEVVGKTDYELFAAELADKFRRDDRLVMETGRPIIDMCESIPSADGTERTAVTSKYPLRDPSGRFVGLYGVGRDETRRSGE